MMKEDLRENLLGLQHGDHVCSLYSGVEEQEGAIAPFIMEGLARGEYCLYLAADRSVAEVSRALGREGLDVSRAQEMKDLQFLSGEEWPGPGGPDMKALAESVKRLVDQSHAPQGRGVRVAAELTWALSPDIGADGLAAWESFWNDVIAEMPVVLLCQYDRQRLHAASKYLELNTHPLVIIEHELRHNFYYQPPDLFLKQEAYGERVGWMLDQLRHTRLAEKERAQRLQEQAARERLSNVLESITEAFFAVDHQWHFTYLNDRAAQVMRQLTGKSAEELLGTVMWEELSGSKSKDEQFYEECHKVLTKRESVHFEEFCYALDKWLEVHAHPTREGLSVYFQDITERKRTEEELQERQEAERRLAEENEVLSEIARIVSSSLDLEQVYERIAQQVVRLVPYERLSIVLPDMEQDTVTTVYATGQEVPGLAVGEPRAMNGTPTAYVISTRTGLLLQEDGQYPETVSSLSPERNAASGIVSVLVAPIVSEDRAIGTLVVGSLTPNRYSKDHLRLAERIGLKIGGAVANAQLHAEIKTAEQTIRQLSTPILQIEDGLLLAPLVGVIYPQRARQLTDELLHAIREERANTVVIDVTGAVGVDEYATDHLFRTVESARLLGATTFVTGISTELAHNLITQGLNLTDVHTMGDLRSGIEAARAFSRSRHQDAKQRTTRW